MGTLRHHVADALAVVAFLWLGGQAALLGVVVQTSAVVAAAREGGNLIKGAARGDAAAGVIIPQQTDTSFVFQRNSVTTTDKHKTYKPARERNVWK